MSWYKYEFICSCSVLIEIPGYIFCILVMDSLGRRPILSFCQAVSGIACIFCGLLQGQTDPGLQGLQVCKVVCLGWIPSCIVCIPGFLIFDWKIWCICLLCHCVCLHCRDVPHCDQEPGSWHLLHGGQDRGHHLPPAGPAQGVLAPSTCLHHGGGCNHCWCAGCLLP